MNLRPLSGQHAKTTMPSLQKQDLEKYLLAYPPLSEQRKIAHVLRTIQASKEKTEAVIGSLKELKKSMMRHLFTYGPVPVGEIGKVKLKQTEIGGMPEEWEAKPIGEIVDEMRYGLSIRSEPKEKYPNLGMNHLKDGKIEVSEIKYVNLEDKLYNKFKVEKGDILFNRTNSAELVGKTAIFDLDYDCVFASYLIRVRVKKDRLIPDYLNHYLNMPSIQQRIKTLASRGVSQSNISATRLSSFQIPLPSIAVQNQICKIIATLDTRIKPEQSKKEALDELFKSTLQNLMTGKVRVNHLEIGD